MESGAANKAHCSPETSFSRLLLLLLLLNADSTTADTHMNLYASLAPPPFLITLHTRMQGTFVSQRTLPSEAND
jgi:hypothetical protein